MIKHDHFRFLAQSNPFKTSIFEGINPSNTTTLDGITSNGHMTALLWKGDTAVVFPSYNFTKLQADVPKIVGHDD
jgi:hypothetical protein